MNNNFLEIIIDNHAYHLNNLNAQLEVVNESIRRSNKLLKNHATNIRMLGIGLALVSIDILVMLKDNAKQEKKIKKINEDLDRQEAEIAELKFKIEQQKKEITDINFRMDSMADELQRHLAEEGEQK
ncbi:MAG: hypothetical protein LUE29_09585 [Lachnospiraceae bacterium]|nr:hypothetical protein [Lachnospiraceae bacterium]